MLDFHSLTPQDFDRLRPYFAKTGNRTCDYSPATAFMWRSFFHTRWSILADCLVLQFRLPDGRYAYQPPFGSGQFEKAVELLREQTPGPLLFYSVTDADLHRLLTRFPHASVHSNPAWSDYLYEASSLATMSGRKLSGQRNHINRFQALFEGRWSCCPITPERLPQLSAFWSRYSAGVTKESPYAVAEREIVTEVIEHYADYDMFGDLLLVDDAIVAFSMGEVVGDTLFCHIEKADTAYHGSYPMMVRCFTSAHSDGVRYLNREEDMGDPGLRTSKLSYHPTALLEKSDVVVE